VLAGTVLVELPGEFHRTSTELRRVGSRYRGLLPAASAADGRCPGNRGKSKVPIIQRGRAR
jgi:hypothetical protein